MGGGRTYGHIPGHPVGSEYAGRQKLVDANLHRQLRAGIWGGQDGAESIVVSGGYADDEDYGDLIIYTGEGGRDPATGRQIADQTLTKGNLGLAISWKEGYPVRVIRGADKRSSLGPTTGFRYDGLYRVSDYWNAVGKHGFRIWRYRLEKITEAYGVEEPGHGMPPPGSTEPARRAGRVQRLIRSTAAASWVKTTHRYKCQICDIALATPAGPYAEGAHIRALGRPHDGPDVVSNILCLCPNHHVVFDAGGLLIEHDLTVLSGDGTKVGRLRTHKDHDLDPAYLAYHREVHRR